MSIFRTTDPTQFDDVDGIIVNESAPAPNIKGVAANIAGLVGVFQRGPATLQEPASIGEFYEMYGKSAYLGNKQLASKKFGRLRIVRVIASDAAKATKAFASSSTDRITFTAKWKGVYGNNITVKIENGTTSGKKYTVHDGNTDAVFPDEIYDNVAVASVVPATFVSSKLVDVTVNSSAAEPSNASATALASGSDGTVADTDYQAAIAVFEVERSCNVLFLDSYNSTRNGYLKTHAAATQDKMVLCAGAESTNAADTITEAASLRDVDGRLIYCYPWLETVIDGVLTYTSPAAWIASIFSQTAPNIDPAYKQNARYTAGVTNLKFQLTRSNYVSLMAAGVCAFEYDSDFGYVPKSGVTTQILDSSKVTISRRRMADYLTDSAASFLKNYQNAPNTKDNRTAVKAAILAFVQANENDGVLPKDSEVKTGTAKLVDTESLNTDLSIVQGYFKILWKQRIFSSMRFIVLQAEIGETVVVTADAA